MFKFIKIYNCTMEKREAIVEQLKVSAKTVYNVKKRFEDGKGLGHQSGAGRPKSVTTPRLINAIKSRVARNPVQTMRGMARDLNVSEKTVRRIVKKNLKAKSFARNQKFLLTDRIKISRLERCEKILNKLKKKMPIILFTDEKYFTVDPITNSRTSRYIAKGRAKDIPDHVQVRPEQ